MGAVVRSLSCSFSLATGSEGVSKLGDSEDAFPAVALDLFRRDSSKQTEVILLHCLVVAALAEFTNLAVIVEDELGRCLKTAQFFHIQEDLLGLPWIGVELYLIALQSLPCQMIPLPGAIPWYRERSWLCSSRRSLCSLRTCCPSWNNIGI